MSKKCRLCLRAIPIDSAIMLFRTFNASIEAMDTVKLIEKYLGVKVEQEDFVSTTICQACYYHLEEFHKFYKDVAAKQLTLQNNLLEANIKKESCVDEHDSEMIVEADDKLATDSATFQYPIDIVKHELDFEDDTDQSCGDETRNTNLRDGHEGYIYTEMIAEANDKQPTDESAMFEYPIHIAKNELDFEDDTDQWCGHDILNTNLSDEHEECKSPDLNKTPSRRFLTMSRKNTAIDINDLTKIMVQLSAKVDSVVESIQCLKKDIKVALQDIKRQNKIFVDVLGENTASLKMNLKIQMPTYTKMFPIKTIDEFQKMEEFINENNEKEISASIKSIIGRQGLKKGLCEIVLPEVLAKFNVDGIFNKMRFLNFEKFCHVLYLASYKENSDDNSFKEQLRLAIRTAKNRHFKEKSIMKAKVKRHPMVPIADDVA